MDLLYIYFVICGQNKIEFKCICMDKGTNPLKQQGKFYYRKTAEFGL